MSFGHNENINSTQARNIRLKGRVEGSVPGLPNSTKHCSGQGDQAWIFQRQDLLTNCANINHMELDIVELMAPLWLNMQMLRNLITSTVNGVQKDQALSSAALISNQDQNIQDIIILNRPGPNNSPSQQGEELAQAKDSWTYFNRLIGKSFGADPQL